MKKILLLIKKIRRKRAEKKAFFTSTNQTIKWQYGHTAGCCFYAPENKCICNLYSENGKKRPLPEKGPFPLLKLKNEQ